MPSADFCRAVGMVHTIPSREFRDTPQISRGKLDHFPRTAARSTCSALDGYGLGGQKPAGPTPPALYLVLVHRLALSLHASFRSRLAATSLRFANPSPPSGWVEDLHLPVVEHARHTSGDRSFTVAVRYKKKSHGVHGGHGDGFGALLRVLRELRGCLVFGRITRTTLYEPRPSGSGPVNV